MMVYSKAQTQEIWKQTFAYILVEEKGNVLTIILNRPQAKNAMSPTMIREYAFAMSYAHHQSHIWAVVFEAKGDIWCAGADLKAMRGQEEENNSSIPFPESEIVIAELFIQIHKPVIAKVNAPVYAGGFLLTCGATFVIASEKTKFGLPEVKRGIYPFQVMASMLQMMPLRKVLDFCVRGKVVDAKEAFELGLITELVAEIDLDQAVEKLLQEIFENSPSAIRLGLKALDKMRSIEDSEKQAFLKQMLQETIQTEDAQEGLKAFAEKRKPIWKGE